MRNTVLAMILSLLSPLVAMAATPGRVYLPALLPASTIACHVPPDDEALRREYVGTVWGRLAELPEMAPFFRDLERSKQELAADIAQNARIPLQTASELVHGRLGFALIDIKLGSDGKPNPEFLVSLTVNSAPDRAVVFSAVMALLNRRDVVKSALEMQGLDPNLPLKTLAQEETVSGYPPMLRIGPNIRIAALGNTILVYHGPGSAGIIKLFDAAAGAAPSLAGDHGFQAVVRGSGATADSAFTYLNVPRVMSILDALNHEGVVRVTEALGVSGAQAIGMAGSYREEGIRHSIHLYMPGQATGLLASLVPMPAGTNAGMEVYAQNVTANAGAMTAMRVNLVQFMGELPYFLESVGAVSRGGGVGGLIANETVLGVPFRDIAPVLGTDLLVQPFDDTQVLVFPFVNAPAFEALVSRMEQNAGERFNALSVGGYRVRYFNRRSSLLSPLAPSFCLLPSQQGGNFGTLLVASHPQAVTSFIQNLLANPDLLLSKSPDFRKAMAGMDGKYSFFQYNDCRDSYRRVYNFLLPVASVWASSSRYPVDTGLLPPASVATSGLFGYALGIKRAADGLTIQAYSPVGINALFAALADRLVISNPLMLGYVYSAIEPWLSSAAAVQ